MGGPSVDKVARGFAVTAIIYGLAGLVVGLQMAISENHGQIPAHAHINMIGWVSFFMFALFYKLFGANISAPLARIHFWLAQVSALGMVVGLWLIYEGHSQFTPLAAISSLTYAASFLVFAVVAYRGLARQN